MELLVATSLILMLAALLLPAAARAREAARRAQCLGSLRQLGIAFLAYADDHGGLLPHEDDGDGFPPYGCGWFSVLGGSALRQCPGLSVDPTWRTYKMNALLEEGPVSFLPVEAVAEPSATVLAFDGRVDNAGVRFLAKGDWDSAARRHGNGTSCLFCDGHVERRRARFDAAGWDGPNGLVWSP